MDPNRCWDNDRRSLWHPYTKHSAVESGPFPVITRGRGVYLYDARGRRYLDAISSWWGCNLGHSHPRLVRAIVRQARELQHSILGNLSHLRAVELATELTRWLGNGARRVFFCGDGASAVEAALKIAVQYGSNRGRPGRTRFAALRDGYHGDTLGAVSVGYVESFHRPFRPLLFKTYRAEAPRCAACPYGKTPDTCAADCFESMRRILEEHAEELAAVIIEPMCQGAAGMRMYPAGYLRKLAAACRRHRVLLIADEIAVGFGRTGRMFAFEHAGINPDIVCVGKGMSGGYLPISAAIVREEIYETFRDTPEDHTFYHGHTFAGNPIAAAVALEVSRVYREEDIVERARESGRVLAEEMQALKGLGGVADVRCLGMIGAVELEPAPGVADPPAQRVRRRMLGKGILLRPLGEVVYLMPPLITPEAVLRRTVRALRESVESSRGGGRKAEG
jgi:adenosylmethionine-8-amino-7-oxononanoate aminotransferase